MNKKIWIILALPIILGCQTLFRSAPQDATLASSTQEPVSTQTIQAATADYINDSFVITRINITNGDLLTQLATEAANAKSIGLAPFVEFDATWCPPCQAIDASIEAKDPLTMQAFDGIYLIRVDVDEWGWGDKKNFIIEAIPVYYKLNDDGFPSGDKVDGGAWNEDIPENFAPVLDAFFHK